ncbi:hypothetical protein [Catenuloplanes japonicus]|uniref:hypothetical protein n=1 Tax=Catenuloplanes japonicus TaxID=33876 RepID=UPI000524667B|nr:hypothetical protein [Catenuloplanes japonicus]
MIVYFQRHVDDDPTRCSPGRDFLLGCQPTVRAKFSAALIAVATAPPKRFAGGGYWEAMHGEMGGWYEMRIDGPGRRHHRLFCLIDMEAEGWRQPLLTVVAGLAKPFRTTFTDRDYKNVRELGEEYRSRNPRSLLER